jgi:hypothetical protein
VVAFRRQRRHGEVRVHAPQRDPPARVEPAVQDAVRARVRAAEAPRAADRAEADVAREKALRDQPRGPFPEVRPVSPE